MRVSGWKRPPLQAQKDADVHLVGTLFHPLEETIHAVPAMILPEFFAGEIDSFFSLDDEFLIGGREFLKGQMDINVLLRAGLEQIVLALAGLAALEGLHDPGRDAERAIRHDPLVIESDDPSKAPAFRAGAQGIVKAKESRRWRADVVIAMGAMPARGVGEALA